MNRSSHAARLIFFAEPSSSNKFINDKGTQQKNVVRNPLYNTKCSVKKWMMRKRCIVTLTRHSFSETANLTGRSRGQQLLSRPLDMNDWKIQWPNPQSDYLVNLRWKIIFYLIFRVYWHFYVNDPIYHQTRLLFILQFSRNVVKY